MNTDRGFIRSFPNLCYRPAPSTSAPAKHSRLRRVVDRTVELLPVVLHVANAKMVVVFLQGVVQHPDDLTRPVRVSDPSGRGLFPLRATGHELAERIVDRIRINEGIDPTIGE